MIKTQFFIDDENDISLSCTSVISYQDKYKERFGELPLTLLAETSISSWAYECLMNVELNHLNVVSVPGMPKGSWILLGTKGGYFKCAS